MALLTSRLADQDIHRLVLDGMLRFGVSRSDTYAAGLRRQLDWLTDNPYLGHLRMEFRPPVRVWPYEAHVIVYLIENEDVLVLRILHQRQDLQGNL